MKLHTIPTTVLAACALSALVACSTSESTSQAPQEPAPAPAAEETSAMTSETPSEAGQGLYALQVRSLEGEPVDLGAYQGKVSLVVNVASECGYTPQYAGLQELYAQMKDRGLVVLGFPCNDFGGQEPGSPAQIRSFCTERYEVTFPMLEKVRTKAGEGQSEVYAMLGEAAGELPRWNFGKYLVGKDGQVIAYFESGVAPDSGELRKAIAAALDA
jgi:glutathione peroxidase